MEFKARRHSKPPEFILCQVLSQCLIEEEMMSKVGRERVNFWNPKSWQTTVLVVFSGQKKGNINIDSALLSRRVPF